MILTGLLYLKCLTEKDIFIKELRIAVNKPSLIITLII